MITVMLSSSSGKYVPSGTLVTVRKIAKVWACFAQNAGGFVQYPLFKPTPMDSVGDPLSPGPTPIELPTGIGVSWTF